MRDVLVLNRNYYPIHIIDKKKVMCLLYKEHAVALDENLNRYNFDEWTELSQMIEDSPAGYMHSVSLKVAIPEIIILTLYDKLPKGDVKFTRKNLYTHYGSKCCYCGQKFETKYLNLDHVIPRSGGGKTSWNNIVLSCYPCNSKKGSRSLKEARMRMHYKPSKPTWKPVHTMHINIGVKLRQSWKKFIDNIYWNSELEKN